MAVVLTGEARARLDAHLDAVEAELARGGRRRGERRGVVDDLEAQVLDMLGERGGEPTVEEVEGVLAGMDPPGAYGEGNGRAKEVGVEGAVARVEEVRGQRSRFSGMAVAGSICNGLAVLLLLALLGIAAIVVRQVDEAQREFGGDPVIVHDAPEIHVSMLHNATRPIVTVTQRAHISNRFLIPALCIAGGVVGPLALVGTVLGWVAFTRIRRSGGMLRGKALALVNGLFWPVLGAVATIVVLLFA